MQSSCEMAAEWFGRSCAQQFRGWANVLHFRLPDSGVTPVIGQFITTFPGLVLRIIFGTDSGIVPEAVSSWPTDHLGDCPSKIRWGLVQLIVWLPLPQTKCLPIPLTAWTKTVWHSLRSDQCPSWNLTYHSCDFVFRCESFWHVLNRGIASSGRAVLGWQGTRLPLSWERIYWVK